MTTVISLMLAIWFWPTEIQNQYCREAQWSQELVYVNNRPQLTYNAKVKSEICEVLLSKYKNETY